MSVSFRAFPEMSNLSTQTSHTQQSDNNPKMTVQEIIQNPIPAQNMNYEPKKKSFVQNVKEKIANIKKFFASANEYTKGTLKGIKNGAIAGSIVYTSSTIYNAISKSAKKLPSKVLGIASAAVLFVGNLWNASKNATKASSDIDHIYIGHQK